MLSPGVTQGLDPERDDQESGDVLEDWLARLRAARARKKFPQVIAAVESASRELALHDDDAVDTEIASVRSALAVEGMRGKTLARTFALLREVAHQTLGMRPYDVQLFAGWVMARGMLAEMSTGEGKTLAATLPAASAALAGMPVHVISCNDYLVERDAIAMGPLYARLGLSVGCVTGKNCSEVDRREAYRCDVTYVTAHQLAFDYLRDFVAEGTRSPLSRRLARLETPGSDRFLRGLVFAVVDEADSVLVDSARTPFVLSRPIPNERQEALTRIVLDFARALEVDRDFELNASKMQCVLGDSGRSRIEAAQCGLSDAESQALLEHPITRDQWVERALTVLHLYQRDVHYVLRDGRIDIIDAATGRRMPDHAWEHGVHQLVECKEGCPVTPRVEPVARISGQRLFSRYLHLAGMSGTAREVRGELARVYRLNTIVVPTRLPVCRRVAPVRVFTKPKERWSFLLDHLATLQEAGHPVLIGTGSISESESLSEALVGRGLTHRVLNAAQDEAEAEVIAQAGQAGHITVATNMAGRGTDIELGQGVANRGGLHVISIDLGESRRYDAQLRGRCARQGDPGSFEQLLCLEDNGVLARLPAWLLQWATRRTQTDSKNIVTLTPYVGKTLGWIAQRAEEKRSERTRRNLILQQRSWDAVLAFAGRQE
jgi:preprotein translocase subunit SecA